MAIGFSPAVATYVPTGVVIISPHWGNVLRAGSPAR
jgi:hypothetical protein